MNNNRHFPMTVKYMALGCMTIGFLYASCGMAIEKPNPNLSFHIYNYRLDSLTYTSKSVETGRLHLPFRIPNAPGNGSPGTAHGSIKSDIKTGRAIGSFKIGIDKDNYCEFRYAIHNALPIRSVGGVGKLKNSCQIDPDTHRYIIIQQWD